MRFKRILGLLLAYLPRPLPVGAAEFEVFASRVLSVTGLYADEDSMKFVLASTLIHADAKYGSLCDAYFINRLRKAAANQVASQFFQDIKTKQQAAANAKTAEDTATETIPQSEQNAPTA